MKPGKPLQRYTPLVAKTPLQARSSLRSSSVLHRSPINPVSKKRQRENRTYAELRRDYLEQHPMCESPALCGQPATEIQHRRGRFGARLLDVSWWAASCRSCNERAETDTGWALATGWLVRIEGDAA